MVTMTVLSLIIDSYHKAWLIRLLLAVLLQTKVKSKQTQTMLGIGDVNPGKQVVGLIQVGKLVCLLLPR